MNPDFEAAIKTLNDFGFREGLAYRNLRWESNGGQDAAIGRPHPHAPPDLTFSADEAIWLATALRFGAAIATDKCVSAMKLVRDGLTKR